MLKMMPRRVRDFYKVLCLNWPNVEQTLDRLIALVGNEIRCPEKTTTFLTNVLLETRNYIKKSEKKGHIRFWCRDRDVLVYFYRGLFRQVAKVHNCQVSVDDETWNPPEESFLFWRQKHPGALLVVWTATNVSKEQIRGVADSILTEQDKNILKGDIKRIWTDPDPLLEMEEERGG